MIDVQAIAEESGILTVKMIEDYFNKCTRVWDFNGAAWCLRSNSIHVFAPNKVKGKWLSRKRLKEVFEEAFSISETLYTSIDVNNKKAFDLSMFIGFLPTEDGKYYITKSMFNKRWNNGICS